MSSLRLEFTPSAAKDFGRLDPGLRPRILKALDRIAADPASGKPLQGPYRGLHSYRVGDYRIVYRIDFTARFAFIHRIGHRQGVYRNV